MAEIKSQRSHEYYNVLFYTLIAPLSPINVFKVWSLYAKKKDLN